MVNNVHVRDRRRAVRYIESTFGFDMVRKRNCREREGERERRREKERILLRVELEKDLSLLGGWVRSKQVNL